MSEYRIEQQLKTLGSFWEEMEFKLGKHIPDSFYTGSIYRQDDLSLLSSPKMSQRQKLNPELLGFFPNWLDVWKSFVRAGEWQGGRARSGGAPLQRARQRIQTHFQRDELFVLIERDELLHMIEVSRGACSASLDKCC